MAAKKKLNVQQLVKGSEAINRMRKEISTVIGVLTSVIDEKDVNKRIEAMGTKAEFISIDFKDRYWVLGRGQKGCWVIQAERSQRASDRVTLLFYPFQGREISSHPIYTQYRDKSLKGRECAGRDVLTVYSELAVLLKDALKHFPFIKERLKYLFDAADAE